MSRERGFLDDAPFSLRPRFLRELSERGEEIGFIPAVQEILQRDNITVTVEGDIERLHEHGGGILFAGDHKHQWEFVALMDVLSRMGRNDMINIAKFYVQRQIHYALGAAASRLIAPVYPRLLAKDRGEFLNQETLNRVFYRRHLLGLEESTRANEETLQRATHYLNEGGVVNIYPCGSIVDSRTHPWREGVGRMINDLSDKGKGDVLVAPYALEGISRIRFLGAIAMRGWGVFGRSQSLDMSLGPMYTADELVAMLPKSDRDDPAAITGLLQRQFIEHFDKK